jgi:hypothetical protein
MFSAASNGRGWVFRHLVIMRSDVPVAGLGSFERPENGLIGAGSASNASSRRYRLL